MPNSVFTPNELFAEIGDRRFDDYASFERSLVERFNAHRLDFPPGYSFTDVVQWGLRRNLVRREGSGVVVAPQ